MGTASLRKEQLVLAAIEEIGTHGAAQVTVAKIARRAGVSSALAFHYFGDKDALFLGAMRHLLSVYGREVLSEISQANGHRERLEAVVAASFAPSNFAPSAISAWLHFYVTARTDPEAARLLRVYQRRLHSNLMANLRPLAGARAAEIAEGLAAMIDGFYIRQSLGAGSVEQAKARTLDYLDRQLAG